MSDMQLTLKEYVKQATLNVYQNEDFVKDIVVEIMNQLKQYAQDLLTLK